MAFRLRCGKKLKEDGKALTPDSLRANSAQYIEDKAFKRTVAVCPSAGIGAMIRSGSFEQKMDGIRNDQTYVDDLPTRQNISLNERRARRYRTRKICDDKREEMIAAGTWTAKAEAKRNAILEQRGEKQKQPAKQTKPAKQTQSAKQSKPKSQPKQTSGVQAETQEVIQVLK